MKEDKLSESQSKAFRTKTASVVKSLKLGDDLRGSHTSSIE